MAERGGFLRHLETVFNFAARDPKGLLYYFLVPANSPSELDKFLLMPNRFQAKFEMTLWAKEDLLSTLKDILPSDAPQDVLLDLAERLVECKMPPAVLRWNLIAQERKREVKALKVSKSPPSSPRGLDATVREIEQLATAMREER